VMNTLYWDRIETNVQVGPREIENPAHAKTRPAHQATASARLKA
jgi:hypothetical protein